MKKTKNTKSETSTHNPDRHKFKKTTIGNSPNTKKAFRKTGR